VPFVDDLHSNLLRVVVLSVTITIVAVSCFDLSAWSDWAVAILLPGALVAAWAIDQLLLRYWD